MEYIVYRRFKAEGIDGAFNLRYGTTVTERDGFLFADEGASDFDPEKWAGAENLYWKNLLRTMNTQELEEFYKKRLGELPKMEG